jgi:hypothetical protein
MSERKVIAVFGTTHKVNDWITNATTFVTAVGADATTFKAPTPPLATVTAAILALQAAQAAVKTSKNAVPARDEKWDEANTLIHQLVSYVQSVADGAGPQGEAVVAKAQLHAKRAATHGPHTFHVEQGEVSGSVHVYTESVAKRAAYDWEYTLDGGKTFIAAPGTLQANTIITGLPVGQNVGFRVRPRTAAGQGDWSAVIYFIVK